jgi:MHS family citrate/tricarballylate:H+ symporter-like MFS transporter
LLIGHTGDKASPGYWLMCAAVLGIIAAFVVYRDGEDAAKARALAG